MNVNLKKGRFILWNLKLVINEWYVDSYTKSAKVPSHAFLKSSGFRRSWYPLSPADTNIVSSKRAVSSIYVGYFLIMPKGEHPPLMYPVCFLSSSIFSRSISLLPVRALAFFKDIEKHAKGR